VLRRHGFGPPEVTFLGKAATLNLLYAFPMLLVSVDHDWLGHVLRPPAWAFTVWGTYLYLWTGWRYLVDERALIRGGAASALV
jgi:cardiolipin synthase